MEEQQNIQKKRIFIFCIISATASSSPSHSSWAHTQKHRSECMSHMLSIIVYEYIYEMLVVIYCEFCTIIILWLPEWGRWKVLSERVILSYLLEEHLNHEFEGFSLAERIFCVTSFNSHVRVRLDLSGPDFLS